MTICWHKSSMTQYPTIDSPNQVKLITRPLGICSTRTIIILYSFYIQTILDCSQKGYILLSAYIQDSIFILHCFPFTLDPPNMDNYPYWMPCHRTSAYRF